MFTCTTQTNTLISVLAACLLLMRRRHRAQFFGHHPWDQAQGGNTLRILLALLSADRLPAKLALDPACC